jgi:ribosomal protein S18 acetylase RimI-like enzyme
MAENRSDEIAVRVIRKDDMNRVVQIDAKITSRERGEYYERKFAQALSGVQHLAASLVAELGGKVVGFMMGDLYLGEFGIPETTATIDTVGVDPDFQGRGVATALMEQFVDNMKAAGVERIHTRVGWDDWPLLKFFHDCGFEPARAIGLEYHTGP